MIKWVDRLVKKVLGIGRVFVSFQIRESFRSGQTIN